MMVKFIKSFDRTIMTKLLVMVLACTILFGCVIGVTQAAEEQLTDWSFYTLSSAAAGYTNKVLAPDATVTANADKVPNVSAGNAGAYLGYYDSDKSGGISGWLSSMLSNSSSTYALSLFDDYEYNEEGRPTGELKYGGFYDYVRFGSLLNQIGFDSPGTAFGSGAIRKVAGGIMVFVYGIATSVDVAFGLLVSLLNMLNPFRWFVTGVNAVSSNLNYSIGDAIPQDSPLARLADLIGDYYAAFANMGWQIIVPFMLVVLLATLLLSKRVNKMDKIKKFVIRVVFLGLGIPLLGSLYTTALTSLADYTVSDMSAYQIVMSTFIDFESWAVNSRLAIPTSDAELSITTKGEPTAATWANLRETCYTINSATHKHYSYGASFDATSTADWNTAALGETTVTAAERQSGVQQAYDVLLRYMDGEFYNASDFDTGVKGQLTNGSNNSTVGWTNENAEKWISQSDEIDDYEDESTSPLADNTNLLFSNGALVLSKHEVYNDDGTLTGYDYRCETTEAGPSGTNKGLRPNYVGGLSTMSMYNYLTSTFNKTKVVVYSNEKAASGAVRESHYSVNLIGGGLLGFLYWLNSIVMLIAVGIIGWFYAGSILFSNIKRSFSLILQVPFALLGSLQGIARVITYTFMLIIEIIATLFAYALVSDLLMVMSDVICVPVGAAFAELFPDNGTVAAMLTLLISVAVFVYFCIMAIRIRKSVVKMTDELMQKVVDRFIVGNDMPAPSDQPGMLQKAAGAAAAGAGMALGQKLMGGSGGTDANGPDAAESGSAQDVATGENGGDDNDTENNTSNNKNVKADGDSGNGMSDDDGAGGGSLSDDDDDREVGSIDGLDDDVDGDDDDDVAGDNTGAGDNDDDNDGDSDSDARDVDADDDADTNITNIDADSESGEAGDNTGANDGDSDDESGGNADGSGDSSDSSAASAAAAAGAAGAAATTAAAAAAGTKTLNGAGKQAEKAAAANKANGGKKSSKSPKSSSGSDKNAADAKAKAENAKAVAEKAAAEHQKALASGDQQAIEKAQANLDKAKAEAAKAEADYQKALAESDVSNNPAVKEALDNVHDASDAVAQAESAYQAAVDSGDTSAIQAAGNQLDVAQQAASQANADYREAVADAKIESAQNAEARARSELKAANRSGDEQAQRTAKANMNVAKKAVASANANKQAVAAGNKAVAARNEASRARAAYENAADGKEKTAAQQRVDMADAAARTANAEYAEAKANANATSAQKSVADAQQRHQLATTTEEKREAAKEWNAATIAAENAQDKHTNARANTNVARAQQNLAQAKANAANASGEQKASAKDKVSVAKSAVAQASANRDATAAKTRLDAANRAVARAETAVKSSSGVAQVAAKANLTHAKDVAANAEKAYQKAAGQSNVATAQHNVTAAKAELREAMRGTDQNAIKSASAKVDAAEQSLRQAKSGNKSSGGSGNFAVVAGLAGAAAVASMTGNSGQFVSGVGMGMAMGAQNRNASTGSGNQSGGQNQGGSYVAGSNGVGSNGQGGTPIMTVQGGTTVVSQKPDGTVKLDVAGANVGLNGDAINIANGSGSGGSARSRVTRTSGNGGMQPVTSVSMARQASEFNNRAREMQKATEMLKQRHSSGVKLSGDDLGRINRTQTLYREALAQMKTSGQPMEIDGISYTASQLEGMLREQDTLIQRLQDES